MDKKKNEIQRKYREQIRERTEREKEDGSSHTFEIVIVLAIIILIFFFNSVFKAFQINEFISIAKTFNKELDTIA